MLLTNLGRVSGDDKNHIFLSSQTLCIHAVNAKNGNNLVLPIAMIRINISNANVSNSFKVQSANTDEASKLKEQTNRSRKLTNSSNKPNKTMN